MKKEIEVLGTEIRVSNINKDDYICITDIAKYKNSEKSDLIIQNWMRNKNTVEFLGLWEKLNNSNFKPLEFEGFRKEAGLNAFLLSPKKLSSKEIGFIYADEADILNKALFGMTAKEWRILNPDKKGNIRDYANIEQLIVLANLESINSELIKMGLNQSKRLELLNNTAISQMKSLSGNKKLKEVSQ